MGSKRESSEENVYQRTLDRVSDAIVSVDDDLRFTYLNKNAENLLDKVNSKLLGEPIWEVLPELKGTVAQDQIEKSLHTNEETKYERYNESVDCWFEARVFPAADGVSIFFNDITERREREAELERYEQIIEMLPVAVGQSAPEREGGFAYVNQGMVEMFDLESKDEANQYLPADLYADPEEREVFTEKLQTSGEIHDYEIELEKPHGEQFWGSETASIDTIGGDEYIIGIIQDVTEQREYKEKLRDLHTATREMVSALTPDSVADIVTRTADRSVGYEMNGVHFYDESVEGLAPASVSETSQELIGDVPVLDEGIAWTAFQTGETQVCNNLVETDNVFNEETALRSELAVPIGDHGVVLVSDTEVNAFRENDLNLIKILAKNAETALDRLQNEQRLRDREEELTRNKELLNQTARVAKLGGWEIDVGTESGNWTDQIYRIYDKSPSESLSLTESIEAFHPEDMSEIQDAWQRLLNEGEPYDLELRLGTYEESVKWVRVIGIPEYNDDGTEIDSARGIMQDITERKKRERKLAWQQDFLEQTQEVANVGGWEADMRIETVQWTDEVCRIHGESLEYQPTLEDSISFYHPDDRDTIRDAFDGLTTEGNPYDLELRIVRRTGEVRWVRTRGEPWYQDGAIVGARGTFQDITERKEREEELRRQNERLDEFASLISHDLRNPLTVALGRTTILQQMLDGGSAEELDVIADALDRMEHIIEDTLTLARKGESVGDMVPVSLLELSGKCWQGVDTAKATLNFEDDIRVRGDANRLEHVFENLFRNAIQHGNDRPTVSIGRIGETGFYIEDDGPGIPERDREDVFEAGYTSERDGTGLGLAIVKRIAEAHSWKVAVTDGIDGGARFEFENVGFADTE